MNLTQRDRKFLGRESAPEDIQVARMTGSFVYDARGRRYIDFLSGWCVGNFGWSNRDIRPKARRRPDYVYPEYLYRPWVELAELLAEISPGKLQKCFRATGGSEAVEIALQIAMAATGRRKFVSLEGSYHGNTIATVSIGSTEEQEPYPNLLSNCLKISPPLDARAAARLERLLKRKDVAAFIMEPISCNLAVLIPEQEFMETAQDLCRRNGALFIADEVACGFGRTGRLFASEHFGLEPDILCMGKAITGGFAPMGANHRHAESRARRRRRSWFLSNLRMAPVVCRCGHRHGAVADPERNETAESRRGHQCVSPRSSRGDGLRPIGRGPRTRNGHRR